MPQLDRKNPLEKLLLEAYDNFDKYKCLYIECNEGKNDLKRIQDILHDKLDLTLKSTRKRAFVTKLKNGRIMNAEEQICSNKRSLDSLPQQMKINSCVIMGATAKTVASLIAADQKYLLEKADEKAEKKQPQESAKSSSSTSAILSLLSNSPNLKGEAFDNQLMQTLQQSDFTKMTPEVTQLAKEYQSLYEKTAAEEIQLAKLEVEQTSLENEVVQEFLSKRIDHLKHKQEQQLQAGDKRKATIASIADTKEKLEHEATQDTIGNELKAALESVAKNSEELQDSLSTLVFD